MAMELLDHWNDEYEGIIINSESLPSKHLSSNRDSSGEKGCGSKLDTEQAALVSVAINCCNFQEGFNYHHAEAGYVMLTYWIPDLPSMLPSGPSHHIGVAALPSMTTRRCL
uniref:Pre-nudix hydrolase domain-containing protein n=1 Tax=Cucumis melo TaxID=3656 RepID=A0A1S4DY95_CUCME